MALGDSVLVTGRSLSVIRTVAELMCYQMESAKVPHDHIITLMWRAESPEEFEARVKAAEDRA